MTTCPNNVLRRGEEEGVVGGGRTTEEETTINNTTRPLLTFIIHFLIIIIPYHFPVQKSLCYCYPWFLREVTVLGFATSMPMMSKNSKAERERPVIVLPAGFVPNDSDVICQRGKDFFDHGK